MVAPMVYRQAVNQTTVEVGIFRAPVNLCVVAVVCGWRMASKLILRQSPHFTLIPTRSVVSN